MLTCPDCGHENLDGAEECEQCETSLWAMSLPRPATSLERSIYKDRISCLKPREPLAVQRDAEVAWVIKLMYDHRVGCAVVVDKSGQPIGIFTDRDALMRLGSDVRTMGDRPVSDFMTPTPTTLQANDRIAFALHRMDLGGYRHLPITHEGRVTGVISVRDILRYMTERLMAVEKG